MGAALAAFGAGELRDVTGSYRPAFVVAGICCLIAAVGVTRIRRRPSAHVTTPPPAHVPVAP